MSQATISAMMRAIAPTIRDYLSDAVRPLHQRLVALEARPAPQDGKPGEPGKDADPARLDAVERAVEAVAAATAELADRAPPEAKEPTPEALQAAVAKHFEANPIPAGEPGKNAEPVSPAEIAEAVAKFFVAHPVEVKHGKDAEPLTPEQLAAAVAEHLKANPPKNGESVKGDDGRGVREFITDAEGNLVAVYSDGTVQKAGPLPRGADGKSFDPSEIAALRQEIAELKAAVPVPAEPMELNAPDDVAELVAKAAAFLAEPPPPINRTAQPLVVNVGAAQQPQKGLTRKTMTMTHNENGLPVFEILEREVA